jgi:peroxiredoxin
MTDRALVAVVLALMLSACGTSSAPEAPEGVQSVLEGRLTVNAAIDSVADYRGFEVVVSYRDTTGVDTLGAAMTDSTGAFAMTVTAPDRGVYPLTIRRRGQLLKRDELVVAAGDTARIVAELPMGNRPLRIRSRENAAWMAYRNARAQHNQLLAEMLQRGEYGEAGARRNIQQTASILWSLRDTYANTIASDIAAAEAVAMLGGWNDSLAVVRAQQVAPTNPSYVEVARVARQAQARREGQATALRLLRTFQAAAPDDATRAGIQSEIVLAHMDSLAQDSALAAARALAADYPDTRWADWTERAIYEIETLMPGMEAPPFAVRTATGDSLRLADLRGRITVLEFYAPRVQAFQRELEARNALVRAAADAPFTIVSYSAEPDTLLNEAFLDGRDVPGVHVFASGEAAATTPLRAYNINTLPTRYLIDREGRIVGKYIGPAMTTLQQDVLALIQPS